MVHVMSPKYYIWNVTDDCYASWEMTFSYEHAKKLLENLQKEYPNKEFKMRSFID